MTARTALLSSLAVGALALAAWLGVRGLPGDTGSSFAVSPVTGEPAGQRVSPPRPQRAPGRQPGAAENTPTTDDMVGYLQATYGHIIDHPGVQMQVLDELIRHYRAEYPDSWREHLLAALGRAFPELADELAARLEQRESYQRWVDDNRARLAGLDPEARRDALWNARNDIFGADDAAAIWQSELENQAIARALEAIDTDTAGIDDKLAMYRASIDDAYGERASATLERRRQQLLDQFLDIPSVQRELADMSGDERRTALRGIRAGMGLDEAALTRWDALDRTRDERWDNGRAYMRARAELQATLSGDELTRALRDLRFRHFGAQAELIEQEEQNQLFRFDRPRRYGRN